MRISPTPSCALFRTVLFVVFLLAPAAWLESQAVPLKATINHTEKMPAVDPLLKPGAQFSLSATEEEPQNFWLRIPDWLAGTWQSDNETRVYNEDFRAGKTDSEVVPFKAKSRFTYGQQTDRQGGIWHYLGIPYCSATDFPNYTEYHQVTKKECLETTGTHISLLTHFTVIRVSKTTRKVLETMQQESITTYGRGAPDQLQMHSSTKVFDASGNPTNVVGNEATILRMEPYIQINSEGGKDLHELFRQFLIAHRLFDRLPD